MRSRISYSATTCTQTVRWGKARRTGYAHRMSTVRNACVAVALLFTACGGQPEPPGRTDQPGPDTTSAFTVELWPGEGIPVIEARRATLLLRASPDDGATIVDSLQGVRGRRLAWDSTQVQTVDPGIIRVLTSARVSGRDLGTEVRLTRERYYQPSGLPDVDTVLAAPAVLEYLQDRAEGTCFVRLDRRIVDANPCPAFVPDSARVERAPVTRWWIRARGVGGAFGWLLVSDSTARSVRREF